MRYDLFLSHNNQYKPWVREFADFLRDLGFSVFFDEDSIPPGGDIILTIERAVSDSKFLLLILSKLSLVSKWVTFETVLRTFDDPLGDKKPVIPILVEPIDWNQLRPSIRRLDIVNLSDALHREREFLNLLQYLGVPDEKRKPMGTWPKPTGIDDVKVADINSVVAAGWSGEEFLDKLIYLDYSIITRLSPEEEGTSSQWAPVFMDHPDTWRILVDSTKQIIGYWHFVPLSPELQERAINGRMIDSEITADKIQFFELAGIYDIYFVSFGLAPQYRRPKVFTMMMNSLIGVLYELALNDIYIGEVYTNAFSPSGISLCKSLGLKYRCSHEIRGCIFSASMKSMLSTSAITGISVLRSLYREKEYAG